MSQIFRFLGPPKFVRHVRCYPNSGQIVAVPRLSALCRLCCKSLFASLVTKFPSCKRDFRINIWGITSPGDELTGDFGNELEAISIGDCGLFRLLARILSHGILGLLQQNLPGRDINAMVSADDYDLPAIIDAGPHEFVGDGDG